MMQTLAELKRETDKSTIIVGNFNNPLSLMDRISRQKINKEMEDFSNSINHLDLTDIHRTLHPKEQNIHSSQEDMEYSLG